MAKFSAQDMSDLSIDNKLGVLATVDGEARPHLSLITTLCPKDPTTLMWGQFCEGCSKDNIRRNPHAAFALMNLDKEVWRGTARWTGETGEGDDFVFYNQKPLFRYNSYFGIHLVHYMDLISLEERRSLSMPGIVGGSMLGGVRGLLPSFGGKTVLNKWSHDLINHLQSLKFLAYITPAGYPAIIPVVPCRAVDREHVVVAATVYRDELLAIRPGSSMAVLALNLEMESVLVRGTFKGFSRASPMATIELDWVYNSMPPKPGQIYPPIPLRAVTRFD